MTFSDRVRARVRRIGEPTALFFGRLGLTPVGLTLIGFGITAVGAVLLGLQSWVIGAIVVFIGGAFDMFDGALARATGQVTRFGAYMDSVFDRWGESLVYVGLTAGLAAGGWIGASVLSAAAMAAAFQVSYTRARSEGLGFVAGTGMASIGVMPREVRLVILCGGLALGGLLGTEVDTVADGVADAEVPAGILVIVGALAVIAIGATITGIQRVLHTRAQARAAAPDAAAATSEDRARTS